MANAEKNNNPPIIAKKDNLYIPGLAFLLLYVVPLFVVIGNIDEYQHIDKKLTILLLLAVSILVIVLGAIMSLSVLAWKPGRYARFLFRFVFFFCLIAGLVFPLTDSAGQIEAAKIPINQMNLFFTLVGAIIITALSMTRLHGILFAVSMTVLIGNAINNTVVILTSISSKEAVRLYEASSEKNLFVLSFDGLPRDATLEVLQENAELAFALKDFIVFNQVISSAPATATSIMSELTGVPNFKQEFDTEGQLYAGITGADVVSNALDENGYRVSTYGTYSSSFANRERSYAFGTLTTPSTLIIHIDQTAEIIDYALARAATRHAVFTRNFAQKVSAKVFLNDDLQSRTAQHKGRSWDVASILTVLDFEKYTSELTAVTDQPVAQFLHFTHTHFPVDFDADCRYRSDDYDWYWENQNRSGVKNEVYCALSQFSHFLDRLHEIGVYDDSLVVLKSDHGKPVAYNDPNRYEGFTVRGHEYWGFGRYTPFLAIKSVGRNRDTLKIDSRHVALSDLATTLCRATISNSIDCERFPGFDLLDRDEKIPDEATYFIYVVKDPSSNFKMDTHEAVEIPRNSDFLSALNDHLTSELVADSPGCEESISTESGIAYNNGMTDDQTWASWRNDKILYLKVHAPSCDPKNLEVVLIASGDNPSRPKNLKLAIDDSPVTEFETSGDIRTGLNVKLVLPETITAGEPIEISFLVADYTGTFSVKAFAFDSRAPE